MIAAIKRRWLKWNERKIKIEQRSWPALERLGTGYGGWIIPANWLRPDSVCYLAGAGEDISFDVAIAEKYGSQVHIFDPTPRAKEHFDLLKSNIIRNQPTPLANTPTGIYPTYKPFVTDLIHFHKLGIWNESTTIKFYAPTNPAFISHSIVNLQKTATYFEAEVATMPSIMQKLGHQRIDLLKLDIEGAENAVIASLVQHNVEIGVICIEFDESASNHLDAKYMDRIEHSLQSLHKKGFLVVAKEPGAHNYTLVHQRLFD